jgi:hypothetical protein
MSQTMLYKFGGDFPYEGEFFTYSIVNDEDIEQALSDGWSLTTTDAIAKGKKPVEVAPVVESEEADDEPAKRRGRPPKAAE